MGDFFKQITRVFTPHAVKVEPLAIDPLGTGTGVSQAYVDAADALKADLADVVPALSDIANLVAERETLTVWEFSDSIVDSDPGNGNIRFNSATMASVTHLYVDDVDRSTADLSLWVNRWAGLLKLTTLYDRTAPGVWTANQLSVVFRITAATNNVGYTDLTVEYISGALPAVGAKLFPELSVDSSAIVSGNKALQLLANTNVVNLSPSVDIYYITAAGGTAEVLDLGTSSVGVQVTFATDPGSGEIKFTPTGTVNGVAGSVSITSGTYAQFTSLGGGNWITTG
jgi:hypothetical protein